MAGNESIYFGFLLLCRIYLLLSPFREDDPCRAGRKRRLLALPTTSRRPDLDQDSADALRAAIFLGGGALFRRLPLDPLRQPSTAPGFPDCFGLPQAGSGALSIPGRHRSSARARTLGPRRHPKLWTATRAKTHDVLAPSDAALRPSFFEIPLDVFFQAGKCVLHARPWQGFHALGFPRPCARVDQRG